MIIKPKSLLMLLVFPVAVACGGAPAAPIATGPKVPSGHVVVRGAGASQFNALVDGNDITGPTVSLTRYVDASEQAIRGQAFNLTIDIAVEGNHAHGLVGSTPLDIQATRPEPNKLHIEGVIRGAPSQFDLSPDLLDGKIGNCTYHLMSVGTSYRGARGCGGGARVEVEVPDALLAWSDAEIGAALGLMLSAP